MNRYDLKSIDTVDLQGLPLKLMAGAAENRIVRPLVLRELLRLAGIPRLRNMKIQADPSFSPPATPAEDEFQPALTENWPAVDPSFESPFTQVKDLAAAYRCQRTTPEQVAQQIIEAVSCDADHSQPLNALIAQDPEDLMAQALESSRRLRAGHPRSLLEGIPIGVKDEMDLVSYPTRAGTPTIGSKPARRDSTVVQRLRSAGAMLIGKTHMHEIGIHPNGHNVHFGMARNPYLRDHDTGGSSSGSAAAVAAGWCPLATGADAGGSIRIPASFCGLVGLKPSFGRLSIDSRVPLCWSVAHYGPIANCIADCELAFWVMAGLDPGRRPASELDPPTKPPGDNGDLSGVRIGIYRPWFEHANDEIVRVNDQAVEHLGAAGAKVREIEIPGLNGMRIAHAITVFAEMAASVPSLAIAGKRFGPATRLSLAAARTFSATDYVTAQRVRTVAIETFNRLYQQEIDLIVTPATAILAPQLADSSIDRGWSSLWEITESMRFVFPANLTGLPAISIPVGYAADGLPIGMQLMASWGREDLLFRAGRFLESQIPRRLPPEYLDLRINQAH